MTWEKVNITTGLWVVLCFSLQCFTRPVVSRFFILQYGHLNVDLLGKFLKYKTIIHWMTQSLKCHWFSHNNFFFYNGSLLVSLFYDFCPTKWDKLMHAIIPRLSGLSQIGYIIINLLFLANQNYFYIWYCFSVCILVLVAYTDMIFIFQMNEKTEEKQQQQKCNFKR